MRRDRDRSFSTSYGDPMNAQETGLLLRTVHQLWPTVPFQTETGPKMIAVWQSVLADIPLGAAEAIVIHHARRGTPFPPSPGQIAYDVLSTKDRLHGTGAPDTDEAWAEVLSAVQSLGYYNGPPAQWSHPAVAAVVRSFGWEELCHGDLMITRAHFVKLYPDAARRVENDRALTSTLEALGMSAAPAAIDVTAQVRSLDAALGDEPRDTPRL